jgi:hypothetical protein
LLFALNWRELLMLTMGFLDLLLLLGGNIEVRF